MKKFKVRKLEVDKLINLLMELYEKGVDYVDLTSDNSVPGQDKLVVHTRDEYINTEYRTTTETTTTMISEDNINDLI